MQRIGLIGRHFNPATLTASPIKVTITGAAGNIGYALIFFISQGRMFGPNQQVELTLLELPNVEKQLQGVIMELQDGAFPLVTSIKGTTDYKEAFTGCQVALLVGAQPRKQGMERKDLLGANAKIFEGQGKALNQYADRNVKVCVVGNPANTNALIAALNAPNIPKENFTALTRLDQNRAEAQIALKLNKKVQDIKNVIIWGNHSTTQYPDINHGTVEGISLAKSINDNKWVTDFFINKVAKRGAEVIDYRKSSSAASAANAVCDHIHDWFVGTEPGKYVSMGVISNGEYGVPKDINFSFPVTCKDGKYTIVQGLQWDEFSKKKIAETTQELLQEKEMALAGLKK